MLGIGSYYWTAITKSLRYSIAGTPMALQDAQEAVREVMRGRRGLRPAEPDNFYVRTSAAACGLRM